MNRYFSIALLGGLLLYAFSPALHAQQQDSAAPLRPPATPLVVHDPFFSVWSTADKLTDAPTKHWTGTPQPINGLIRVDGKTYRYLGNGNPAIPALEEVHQEVTPTRTIVTMQSKELELTLTFLTPAFPDDLAVMARPVTYLTWDVRSRNAQTHNVELYLDVEGSIATNQNDEPVFWSRAELEGLHVLRMGSAEQPVLKQAGDGVRINWGYFYLAVPSSSPAEIAAGNWKYREPFAATGHLPAGDDLDQPREPRSRFVPGPAVNIALPLGEVGTEPVTRHALLAYDDTYSVEYMRQKLQGYWHKEFPSISALLEGAEHDYPSLKQRSEKYDANLTRDLAQAGGPEYAAIASLAFRQAIAAHKLVEDIDGVPFFMPKENFSNGSISTVDVIYPSAPMFLFLNPKLVEAQLEPVLRYAQGTRWKFPFAPHDLGVYPLANGQLYGGGEVSEDDQMPVEESGDILLLVDAIAHVEHNAEFAKRYWPLLTKWADYLLDKGFDPEKQLSTDDFAGHLAHNTNLSIKAIEALGAYAQLAKMQGDSKTAARYENAARSMAAKWEPMAKDGDHYRLAFDKPDTWSQKYNLVWDDILDLHLFPAKIADAEVAFYKAHLNRFGLPLDNRKAYTKLDWTLWSATLAQNAADFQTLVHPVYEFLEQTPDHVPMTDWYDTVTGHKTGFQARAVVGGVYIKMLADPKLWSRWAEKKPESAQWADHAKQ